VILPASILILLVGAYLLPPLLFTGDEPRYLFASYSIWSGHGLSLPNEMFNWWFERTHGFAVAHSTGHGPHSVVHAALLSPIVGRWGLEPARWASAMVGVVGLVAFPTTLRNLALSPRYTLVIALLMLTVPVLPYMKLIYGEIWLFSLVAWLLALVSAKTFTTPKLVASTALCVCLVFIHLRAAPIAGVFGAYIAFRAFREGVIGRRHIAATAAVLCLAILVWLRYQIMISGGVTQSASPAVAPSPSLFLDRLAIQLAGFRHGLLLYAPIHLVGFAGVLVAIRHRTQLGVLLFLLLVTYMFVFVWGVASESYTARFWVVAMPIVLLGTALWIDRAWNVTAAVGVLPIAVYTLAMTVALFNSSQLFLENRFHSVVFDELVEKGVPFNFALYAPWDPFDLTGIEMIGEKWTAGVLTLLAGFLLALVLLCARGARARAVGMAAAIGLSGLVGYWSHLDLIELGEAEYAVASGGERRQVEVAFKAPTVVRGFRVGRISDIPLWNEPNRPKSFEYEVVDVTGGTLMRGRASGRQINTLSIGQPIAGIRLRGIPSEAEWPVEDTRFFR